MQVIWAFHFVSGEIRKKGQTWSFVLWSFQSCKLEIWDNLEEERETTTSRWMEDKESCQRLFEVDFVQETKETSPRSKTSFDFIVFRFLSNWKIFILILILLHFSEEEKFDLMIDDDKLQKSWEYIYILFELIQFDLRIYWSHSAINWLI